MARILIVDDSTVARKSIRSMLEKGGHEIVAEAADGREVLTVYINHKPDVVTMDISMKNVDGTEALKMLLKSFPQAKVIMISALGQKQQVLDTIMNGAKSYIVKPFDSLKLLAEVDKVMADGSRNSG